MHPIEVIILAKRSQRKSNIDLANAIGVTDQTVSNWLSKNPKTKREISLEDFIKVCNFLGIETISIPK